MAFKRNCDNAFNYHDFVEYLTTAFPERIGKFNKIKDIPMATIVLQTALILHLIS